jgi:hypothetical protein
VELYVRLTSAFVCGFFLATQIVPTGKWRALMAWLVKGEQKGWIEFTGICTVGELIHALEAFPSDTLIAIDDNETRSLIPFHRLTGRRVYLGDATNGIYEIGKCAIIQ